MILDVKIFICFVHFMTLIDFDLVASFWIYCFHVKLKSGNCSHIVCFVFILPIKNAQIFILSFGSFMLLALKQPLSRKSNDKRIKIL